MGVKGLKLMGDDVLQQFEYIVFILSFRLATKLPIYDV